MTQMTREIKRNPQANQEAVSFRLPRTQLEWLDKTVEAEGSSRTGVIRAALAIYQRLAKGGIMLVPATVKTQEQLRMLSELKQCPEETLAGELLKSSLEQCIAKEEKRWCVSITFRAAGTSPKSQHTQAKYIKGFISR